MKWKIEFSPEAEAMFRQIRDRRVREKIAERIDELAHHPEKLGKPLRDELAGYHSLRAVGQRYRIIYKIEKDRVLIFIVAVGLRKAQSKKDIYSLAQKMVRLKLL